ncbi:hypothetical protein BKI51_21800 [Alphaproteobacteria bacterium AO1-B]|nr:hypothetical protein BKI51_21800 [Alphaproteobacteria bacterium AO1-B]
MARPEKEPKTELAVRLRKVRQALGDPDRGALVEALGVSVGAIARYERGEAEPTASVLAAYRTHYGIDLDWLITGEGSMRIGEGIQVDQTNMAHVRKCVWNIAETYWESLPRRTKPEEFADRFVAMLDYLVSREDLQPDAASEVIQFDVERQKRSSD